MTSFASGPIHALLSLIIDALVRSGLLLCVMFALDAILAHCGRTLLRSACWNMGLVGLLLIPAATVLVPPVPVALLRPVPSLTEPLPLSPTGRPDHLRAEMRPPTLGLHVAGEVGIQQSRDLAGSVHPGASDKASAAFRLTAAAVAVSVYALGVLIIVARFAASLLAVRQLCRESCRLSDLDWAKSLNRACRLVGIHRPVVLCTSDCTAVPVAVGWRSPRVVIPPGLVETSTATHRDSILLHELAHVRRNDYAWQLVLKVVQAVYWPNPLVWLAARQMSTVREQVCDEVCTHHADAPEGYRDTLLHVAGLLVRRPALALGICMARTPHLTHRLTRIAQGRRSSRCVAHPAWHATLGALALAFAMLLGSAQLVRSQSTLPAPSADEKGQTPEGYSTRPYRMPRRVMVTDANTSEPIMGATVAVSCDGQDSGSVPTGERGDAVFQFPQAEPQTVSLLAGAEGYAPTRVTWSRPGRGYRWPGQFTVQLEPGSASQKARELNGEPEDATAWTRNERTAQILDRRIESYMKGPIPGLYGLSLAQTQQVRERLEQLKEDQLRYWRAHAAEWAELQKNIGKKSGQDRSAGLALNRASPLINEENVLKEIEKLLPPEQAREGRERYEARREELRNLPAEDHMSSFMRATMLAPGEGSRRMLEEGDGWKRYVEQFCELLKLTDDQRATAQSILRETASRRDDYMDTHQEQIDDAIEARNRDASNLLMPIEPIWEELRSRLDAIPTSEQMAMMRKRRPQSPATSPTDYISPRWAARPLATQRASAPAPPSRARIEELARRHGGIVLDDPAAPGGARIDMGGTYQIGGTVARPGRYTIAPGKKLSLGEAIRAAGGIDSSGRRLEARVTGIRQKEDFVQTYDVSAVLNGTAADPQLASGDRIVILGAP